MTEDCYTTSDQESSGSSTATLSVTPRHNQMQPVTAMPVAGFSQTPAGDFLLVPPAHADCK